MPFPLQKEKIREKFVEALKTEFAGKGLRFSRGTSFPAGWGVRGCQAQAGDTVYLCQFCPPCSVRGTPHGELSPPFLSPVHLARKSKALPPAAP